MSTTTPAADDASPALVVRGVSYSFRDRVAVDGVSFDVASGSIHGFVGPNGAGKTTTLKIIATLLEPKKGRVAVFGDDVTKKKFKVRRNLGYMPDHLGVYRQMTVFEYLDFFAAAYGLSRDKRDPILRDVLQLTDMHGRRDELIRSLSRGMEQRLSLARVLVHDPKLLLLDEPASGLDPRARIELMDILRELAAMGKTVLISSHILGELADLCDAVTIIDRGKVRYSGSMAALLEQSGERKSYRVELAAPIAGLADGLRALDGVGSVTEDGATLLIESAPEAAAEALDPRALLRAVLDAGGVPSGFQTARRRLDEVFMDLTQPGVQE